MAKVSFNKLGLKLNTDVKTIEYGDQIIEIKQYLPTEEKLELIGNVLQLSHDTNNFSNPIKVSVYTTLEIIEKYTNINFTDKQKENPLKLYDLIIGNGLITEIIKVIPEVEYNEILKGVYDVIDSVYRYQTSVLGILDTISSDYSNLKLDAIDIQQELKNAENLELLKNVLTKLG